MKTKKFLHVIVTNKKGKVFNNPLKLSESYIISKLAQDNLTVVVECKEVDLKYYNSLFG